LVTTDVPLGWHQVWLAANADVPIYVHRRVWDQTATPLRSIINRGSGAQTPGNQERLESVVDSNSSAHISTTATLDGIPVSIKRLRRELDVAISEEDYKTAARIRDHPFMQLYAHIEKAEREGREAHSKLLRDDLCTLILQQHDLNQRHQEEWQELLLFPNITDNNIKTLGSS
jgi:hypothetical protein